MADIPHFDLPFRFVGSNAAVVEQDSLEDITNCVEAVVRTIIGQRVELPDFGIPDPTFQTQPLQLQAITEAILQQEPRATIAMTQNPDRFNQLVVDVLMRVSAQEVTGD